MIRTNATRADGVQPCSLNRGSAAQIYSLASSKSLAKQASPICQSSSKRAHCLFSRVPSHLKRYASLRDHLYWLPARGEGTHQANI